MESRKLFSFKTCTTNPDYLSLYRWVPSTDDTGSNTVNLQESMSEILSKIAGCPALRMNKDKSQLSFQESKECNELYIKLLEKISDVFSKMPKYLLNPLPGYSDSLLEEIKGAIQKLKLLQNNVNSAPLIRKPEDLNNYYNGTTEINNDYNETIEINNHYNETIEINNETTQINNNYNETIEMHNGSNEITVINNHYNERIEINNDYNVTTEINNDYNETTEVNNDYNETTEINNDYNETINVNDDLNGIIDVNEINFDEAMSDKVDDSIDNVESGANNDHTIDNSGNIHDIYLTSMLKDKFNLKTFKEKQIEIIEAARCGHHCFLVMPVGSGMSLCYQMPAVMSTGVTIVVSPLRDSINKQIERLKTLKISVAYLAGQSTQTNKTDTRIHERLSMVEPDVNILYLTPEKLRKNTELQNVLLSVNENGLIRRFVIEEAQQVLQWEAEYREDICQLLGKLNVPIMALSTCASNKTVEDVQKLLKMDNCKVFRTSLNQPNVSYNMMKTDGINDLDQHLALMVKTKFPSKSGVIYCLTRGKCEKMANVLTEKGVAAVASHSKVAESIRTQENKPLVICTTIVNTMKIVKPDVCFVLYSYLPNSIEDFLQTTAYLAKYGQNVDCHVCFSQKHFQTRYQNINRTSYSSCDLDSQLITEKCRQITDMHEFCKNVYECRRLALLQYFDDEYKNSCGDHQACDNCRNTKNRNFLSVE